MLWAFGFSLLVWGIFHRFFQNDWYFFWSLELQPVISQTGPVHLWLAVGSPVHWVPSLRGCAHIPWLSKVELCSCILFIFLLSHACHFLIPSDRMLWSFGLQVNPKFLECFTSYFTIYAIISGRALSLLSVWGSSEGCIHVTCLLNARRCMSFSIVVHGKIWQELWNWMFSGWTSRRSNFCRLWIRFGLRKYSAR